MEDALRAKHRGLIDGLAKLFDLLVAMRYLAPTDVHHPPHVSPPVDTAGMEALGFDPEVVALADLLPQLRPGVVWGWQEEGTALMPRSKAVSYLVRPDNGYDELWELMRVVDYVGGKPLLPPTVMRLTDGDHGVCYGTNLLYDAADQSIIVWSTLHNKTWDEYPRRPSGVVLDEIAGRLQRLEWVPRYDPDGGRDPPVRELIETPAYMANANEVGFGLGPGAGVVKVPLDDDAAFLALARQYSDGGSVDNVRWQVNNWRALQKLYRDAGWEEGGSPDPSGGFDGDGFERAREDWIRRFKAIDSEWGPSLSARTRQDTMSAEEQVRLDEFDQRWEAFWSESAGDRYV